MTHLRGARNIPCRYDQVWVSSKWTIQSIPHLTEASFEAGFDHALVVAEIRLTA